MSKTTDLQESGARNDAMQLNVKLQITLLPPWNKGEYEYHSQNHPF